jgi:hypothetical protein
MEIKIGSIIKILCLNGVTESGKLIEHTKYQMVLELFDRSFFIVQDPYKNVVVIKTSISEMESSDPGKVLVEEDPEPDQYYRKEELRAKSLADLHKLKAARELLQRSMKVETLPEVEFGNPIFAKPIPKYPKKKAR